MENSEQVNIINWHSIQAGFPDGPCLLRASGKIEVHDESRMPKDEAELEQWKTEMIEDSESKQWLIDINAEYLKEGCTEKALIVAIWEKVMENRPEAADALEIKRQDVKLRILKPE